MAININLSGAHPLQNPYMGVGQFSPSAVGGIPMMQLMYVLMQMMMQMMQMMGGGPAGGFPMQMAPGQFGSPGGFGGNPMMGGGSPLGGFLGGGGSPGAFPGGGGYPNNGGGYPGNYPGANGPQNPGGMGPGSATSTSIAWSPSCPKISSNRHAKTFPSLFRKPSVRVYRTKLS